MSNYRLVYMSILGIIGILLIFLNVVAVIDSIWFYIGIGLLTCSSIRIYREVRIRKDKDYKTRLDIAQNDERNIENARKAATVAFRFSVLGLCVLEILLFAFNQITLGNSIGLIVCAMLLIYWIAYIMLS